MLLLLLLLQVWRIQLRETERRGVKWRFCLLLDTERTEEVVLLENDFRNLSPAVTTTTPQKGQNQKKSKPVIDLGSYLRLNYWWKNYDLFYI